jgi:hypothetical protein
VNDAGESEGTPTGWKLSTIAQLLQGGQVQAWAVCVGP